MELGMKPMWVLHKLHEFIPVMLEALELSLFLVFDATPSAGFGTLCRAKLGRGWIVVFYISSIFAALQGCGHCQPFKLMEGKVG